MNATFPQRQSGAALIIGLILLMVLTILGVSGLSTATLEVAMADNMQRGQYVFQAAESALNSQIQLAPGQVTLTGGETRDDVLLQDVAFGFDDTAGNRVADVLVDTTFQGYVAFGAGSQQVHFESRGVATTPSRGARSTQRAGYFVLAPSP
ncbi:MAG: PilX N-terminal domain-containing pilus assembly protein [Gammaproteobacteria bacterium]|nr:PilX N-terminal domain-containing pilus assembly protein [Gammaproteobacteria bacterium]MDH3768679.1 PilX N-terminal domain-containing pilus assembly protein [Gammaproteobacteria bacterium]